MALPPPSPSATCLVTGASSGIGADIARELAARGYGVTLVARREDRLKDLAAELEQHGVRAEPIACDLTDEDARKRMAADVAERGLDVEVLVNNAGFASGGEFNDLDIDSEIRMIRTNVEAVTALCGEFVPGMVERGRGGILNVASVAAFQPIPRQATYAATKAFVLSFSDALSTEMRSHGITVTCLCPGPVPTEFDDVAELSTGSRDIPGFLTMSSEDTAAAGVKGLEKGRRVVTPGVVSTVSALSGRFTPRSIYLPLADKFYPVR